MRRYARTPVKRNERYPRRYRRDTGYILLPRMLTTRYARSPSAANETNVDISAAETHPYVISDDEVCNSFLSTMMDFLRTRWSVRRKSRASLFIERSRKSWPQEGEREGEGEGSRQREREERKKDASGFVLMLRPLRYFDCVTGLTSIFIIYCDQIIGFLKFFWTFGKSPTFNSTNPTDVISAINERWILIKYSIQACTSDRTLLLQHNSVNNKNA